MRVVLVGVFVACFTSGCGTLPNQPQPEGISQVDKPASPEPDSITATLGVPFGTMITVQGVVVEGPGKGYEGGPNLRVQRINGKATQQDIQIKLRGGFEGVEPGKTYEFEGYETGGFVGMPRERYIALGLQTTGHYFRHELSVHSGKAIDAIAWSPADFAGREALLEGTAVNRDNRSYIDGNGWSLLTDPAGPWPKELEGKTVETLGAIAKADGEYRLEKGVARLVKLEDQKGRAVELRGKAFPNQGRFGFEYRGTTLVIELKEKLPGWQEESDLHGRPVIITGTLEEAELPDPMDKRAKKKTFIIRKAAWKRLDTLLAPERIEPN